MRVPHPVFLWLAAGILGAFFLVAAIPKIYGNGPTQFLADLRSFHLLGDPWAAHLAISLPLLELVCGVALISGWKRRAASFLTAAMLLVFIAGLASAAYRGIDITCGCFGKAEGNTNIATAVGRNIGLLALALLTYLWTRPSTPTTQAPAPANA